MLVPGYRTGFLNGVWAGRLRFRIPAEGRVCSRERPDRLWGPHSLLLCGYCVSFPGVKRPGRDVMSQC